MLNMKDLKKKALEYVARLTKAEERLDDHEARLKALEAILITKNEQSPEELELEISPTKFKGLDQ